MALSKVTSVCVWDKSCWTPLCCTHSYVVQILCSHEEVSATRGVREWTCPPSDHTPVPNRCFWSGWQTCRGPPMMKKGGHCVNLQKLWPISCCFTNSLPPMLHFKGLWELKLILISVKASQGTGCGKCSRKPKSQWLNKYMNNLNLENARTRVFFYILLVRKKKMAWLD